MELLLCKKQGTIELVRIIHCFEICRLSCISFSFSCTAIINLWAILTGGHIFLSLTNSPNTCSDLPSIDDCNCHNLTLTPFSSFSNSPLLSFVNFASELMAMTRSTTFASIISLVMLLRSCCQRARSKAWSLPAWRRSRALREGERGEGDLRRIVSQSHRQNIRMSASSSSRLPLSSSYFSILSCSWREGLRWQRLAVAQAKLTSVPTDALSTSFDRLLTSWYIFKLILWLRIFRRSRATRKTQREVVQRRGRLGYRHWRTRAFRRGGSVMDRDDRLVNSIASILG